MGNVEGWIERDRLLTLLDCVVVAMRKVIDQSEMRIDDERSFVELLSSTSLCYCFIEPALCGQKVCIPLMSRVVSVIQVDSLVEFFFSLFPVPVAAKGSVSERG